MLVAAEVAALTTVHATPQSQQLTLSKVIDSGSTVFLSDGSAWEIRSENRQRATQWPLRRRIRLYRTSDTAGFPYRLVLLSEGQPEAVISARALKRLK